MEHEDIRRGRGVKGERWIEVMEELGRIIEIARLDGQIRNRRHKGKRLGR